MPPFRTRPDGTVYPLGGMKGKVGAVGIVAAGAIAISMTSGGLIGGGSVGASSGARLSPGMQAKVLEARTALRKGKPSRAWRQLGLKQGAKRARRHAECTSHSYGAVQGFFAASPGRSLRRMTLPLADSMGNSIVLSVSWVRMVSAGAAARLKLLVDVHGTDNVAPLGMRAMQRRGITFTGNHYESDLDRSVVVIAEAEPADGQPDDELIDAAVKLGVELPRPK